jgi:hypothetical protein
MIKDEHAAAAAALVLLKAVVEIGLQGAEGLIGDLRNVRGSAAIPAKEQKFRCRIV